MNGMRPVVCCLLAGLVTAAAGSGATKPVKHFAVVFSGSGSYTVDFGEDRFEELKKKPTSGGGVDGKASITWSWTLKTVASRTGDKPVGHDRAILQASYELSGKFLVYSFNGRREMSERPIACNIRGNYRTFDGEERASLRGDWVKWNPALTYNRKSVSFSARFPGPWPRPRWPATTACMRTSTPPGMFLALSTTARKRSTGASGSPMTRGKASRSTFLAATLSTFRRRTR